MLVPYSRTLFFHDKGTARGVTAQAMHELRPATSYYESLVALNERFAVHGKPPGHICRT